MKFAFLAKPKKKSLVQLLTIFAKICLLFSFKIIFTLLLLNHILIVLMYLTAQVYLEPSRISFCENNPFPNVNGVSYSQVGNEAKRDSLTCYQRKVKQTLFKSNTFQMNFKFIAILFYFWKNFRIRLFKKNCCARQNIVIERIIDYYWYLLSQNKKLVAHLELF